MLLRQRSEEVTREGEFETKGGVDMAPWGCSMGLTDGTRLSPCGEESCPRDWPSRILIDSEGGKRRRAEYRRRKRLAEISVCSGSVQYLARISASRPEPAGLRQAVKRRQLSLLNTHIPQTISPAATRPQPSHCHLRKRQTSLTKPNTRNDFST